MKRTFQKFLSVFLIVIISMFMLVACEKTPDKPDEDAITEEKLQALVFNDATFEYDGEPKSIFVENIYEDKGVTVSYINNSNKKPGTFTVTATIKYESIKVTKKAKVTITKASSVLEADAIQTVYLTDSNFSLKYKLNNDKQEVNMYDENGKVVYIDDLTYVGVHNLELYAKENDFYKESNHVKVTFNVIKSKFDIKFDSKEVIADGTEKTLEITGELPAEFTVEYQNNKGIEDGLYFAVATIKNAAGEVVETHNAVLKIENPENEEFKKYLDEFFVSYLEEDQLSVNIFCEDPEKFGLKHYDAAWYTYDSFDDSAIEHDLNLFKDMLTELEGFKDAELNDLQESAYKTIESFLDYYIEFYGIEDAFYTSILYVDQFGGYVADFGTYMEAYSLRSELEVQDVVKYIESTKTAFPSYLEFVAAKADRGYALSDFTIKEMKKYLADLLEAEEYYLEDILNVKIDNLEFLDETKKESYKKQIADAIDNCFIPGVQELHDGLDAYLGLLSEEEEGYLASYDNGSDIFMLKLKDLLGFDEMDQDAYIMELDRAINTNINAVIETQQTLIDNYNISSWRQLEQIIASNSIYEGTPDEMMVFLEEFAKTIVPELKSKPEIVIKEMDEASAKVSNAVAYYMKSAIDNTASEYITLNPVQLGESAPNDVLGTLAHEGYPGHLYAYVYSKELGLSNLATIMTSTAHGEGWATYVELKLYEYAIENSTDNQFKEVMDYLYANQLMGFLLETRLDAGIHLEGWDVEQVANYMDGLGYSADSAGEIYNLLIETPSQYAAYGYGKLTFYNLHVKAQEVLGIYYDEIEFNTMLLSKGWTGLGILQETYEEYMETKCHELGIAYN